MKNKRISWREQLERMPQLRDIRQWPVPVMAGLTDVQQAVVTKRRQAFTEILAGFPIGTVASTYGTRPQEIYRLLDRALGCVEGESPMLSRAWLPEQRVGYEREASCDGKDPKLGSLAGAFGLLQQQHPDVFKALRQHIEDEIKGKPGVRHLNNKAFNTKFSELLILAKVRFDQYPYNTVGRARQSLSAWRHQTRLQILADRAPVKALQYALLSSSYVQPMSSWQFDEHAQDFETSLLLDMGDGKTLVRVSRFWVALFAEEFSSCGIGRSFGFSRVPRGDDFLACMESATQIWTPYRDLPESLQYRVGSGFPSMYPELQHVVPTIVKIDNAWSHYLKDAGRFIHTAWKSVINPGRPEFPVARRVVEMVIRRLTEFEHSYPSTTGSSIHDPRRDRRRDRVPIVPIYMVPVLVDLCLAEINSLPRGDLPQPQPAGDSAGCSREDPLHAQARRAVPCERRRFPGAAADGHQRTRGQAESAQRQLRLSALHRVDPWATARCWSQGRRRRVRPARYPQFGRTGA